MTAQPDYPWWVGQSGPLAVWAWHNCPDWRFSAWMDELTPEQRIEMRLWAERLWQEHVAGQAPVEEEFSET